MVLFDDRMLHALSEKNRVWRHSGAAICGDAMLSFFVDGFAFFSLGWCGCVLCVTVGGSVLTDGPRYDL